MASDEPNVPLTLSRDEALVLFEFLTRYSDDDELLIRDQAEQRVLWNLLCALESQLHEPINNPDWEKTLQRARDTVRDKVE